MEPLQDRFSGPYSGVYTVQAVEGRHQDHTPRQRGHNGLANPSPQIIYILVMEEAYGLWKPPIALIS
jgi:hypothetical protein